MGCPLTSSATQSTAWITTIWATVGFAEGGRALDANHAAGKTGEDRSQGRPPWSLCHFPIGRGYRAPQPVPGNLGPD